MSPAGFKQNSKNLYNTDNNSTDTIAAALTLSNHASTRLIALTTVDFIRAIGAVVDEVTSLQVIHTVWTSASGVVVTHELISPTYVCKLKLTSKLKTSLTRHQSCGIVTSNVTSVVTVSYHSRFRPARRRSHEDRHSPQPLSSRPSSQSR